LSQRDIIDRHTCLTEATETRSVAGLQRHVLKILFTYFVDVMFTTLLERLFTKRFDRGCKSTAESCVYPPRISD
jgi:hypothetical protein